jgi:hypothetical protein
MLDVIKGLESAPVNLSADEISAPALLEALNEHPAKTLVFRYEGADVQAGYHVTEVKSGQFQALDCGGEYENWHETFIQLWDIPQENERRYMPVSKFLAIINKVASVVPIEPQAKVTFEVSNGIKAMALYRASSITIEDDIVRVELSQRPASCKPRDRWLLQAADQAADQGACCQTKKTPTCSK